MENNSITLTEAICRNKEVGMNKPVNLSLLSGEHVAIVGENGAGKSLLIDMITGKSALASGHLSVARDAIRQVAFRDSYGQADVNYYYQQRWNQTEQDDVPTVSELLGSVADVALQKELFGLFDLHPMLHKKIIILSSGELRKFQLAKALIANPKLLIIDNPFIGLDAPTRDLLRDLLEKMIQEKQRYSKRCPWFLPEK